VNARADRFPLIDSLRGIAALMIVATHVGWFSGVVTDGSVLRPYLTRLEAGIAVFFVISGFLLYRPFVKARLLDAPPVPTRAYAWRRFLRIVPAFWVAVTVVALWIGIDELWHPRELVINYGFLQLYRGASVANVIPQAWTLCVEVTFYAALPLWAWLMRRLPARDLAGRLRWELGLVGALVAGSLAYNALLVYSGATGRITLAPGPVLSALPGFLDHLGLGMLLAVASVWIEQARDGRLPQPLAFLARYPSVCWAIAAVALWFGATQIGLSGNGDETYTPAQFMGRHLLNSLIAVALILPAVFGKERRGFPRRVLGHPALMYVGLVSYGFYLFHFAVIMQLRRWGLDSPALWYPAAVAGALLLGSLSYYLVERPALSLKRLVGPRPDPVREEAIAESAPLKV
jgi:peptidoglycan/LPS O-acetylase OafA/YrhL